VDTKAVYNGREYGGHKDFDRQIPPGTKRCNDVVV